MLLQTRQWILMKEHYEVAIAASHTSALHVLDTSPIDLCVLCHTLTEAQRRSLRSTAEELWPGIRILQLTTPVGKATRVADQDAFNTGDGPVALLQSVRASLAA